jgi:hypothetical protein
VRWPCQRLALIREPRSGYSERLRRNVVRDPTLEGVKTTLSLPLVALCVAIGAVACGGSGPDRESYVQANEALFHQLPVFPGAQLQEEVSAPAYAESDGPIVGYTTRFDFDLPQDAQVEDVASFYRRQLQPEWRLVEELDGPVLNFRKGSGFVSINLESREARVLEVAVDHNH